MSSVPPKQLFLGTCITPVSGESLLDLISAAIGAEQRLTIGHQNLHSLYLLRYEPVMQAFFARADLVYIDGMSLVVCGKILGLPLRRQHRVTFLDIVDDFMSRAAREGWRLFLLGSLPGVADRAAAKLVARYPGLVCDAAPGYFDTMLGSPDNEALLARIRAFCPHVVLVGMGMPRQEEWVLQNGPRIEANVTIVLGGILDYLSGDIRIPPRLLGRLGLEWLFRLLSEPRRLWKRYLVEPWVLVGLTLRDLMGRRLSGRRPR